MEELFSKELRVCVSDCYKHILRDARENCATIADEDKLFTNKPGDLSCKHDNS